MSLFSTGLEEVLGGIKEIGAAAGKSVKDIAIENIESVRKNATVKSSNPDAFSVVTTGTSPTGAAVVPGVNTPVAGASGVPAWAWVLGGLSLVALTVGVVVVVKS